MRFAHFGHVYFPVRVSNFCAAPNSRGLLTIFSYTLVFVLFRENVLAAVRFFASFWVLFRNFRLKSFSHSYLHLPEFVGL